MKSAAVLEAAYEEVEAGRLIDHPKQAALQKTLTGIVTMHPVRLPTTSVYKGAPSSMMEGAIR